MNNEVAILLSVMLIAGFLFWLLNNPEGSREGFREGFLAFIVGLICVLGLSFSLHSVW